MNLKITLLSVAMWGVSVCAVAQSMRNPLNHEPARVALQRNASAWKLADETFYRADGVQFDKSTIAYDENGRKVADLMQKWNEKEHTWQDASKRDYLYEDGKTTVYTLSATADGWQNVSKVETRLDPKGKPVYSLTYAWNMQNADWSIAPSLRSEWVYDDEDRVVTFLKQHPNKETGEWNVYDTRILYVYDKEGSLSEEVYQSMNVENGLWTNVGKYVYDKKGEKQCVALSFVSASDTWVSEGKTIYTYDQEGKVTRGDYYGSDAGSTLNAYSVYTYSESVGCPVVPEAEKDVRVYPNPVVSSFELTVPDEFVGKALYLFDLSGKQTKSATVKDTKMQVDVAGLTSGVYLLRVEDVTKKIVIK